MTLESRQSGTTFAPIDLETKMFDLDVSEVSSLIELRAATKEVK